VRPELLPRDALGLSLLREEDDEERLLLLREALGLSLLREELRKEDDGRLLLLRVALGLSLLREELREDDADLLLLLPPEAPARLLERDDPEREELEREEPEREEPLDAEARPERLLLPRPGLREPLVSPAWARSLFTVRAAISSAVPSLLPRFS
jgi:hypothetical protein